MTRTLGRMLLLSAAAVLLFHGRSGAEEPSPLSGILEIQKKLGERIDFEVPAPTTLGDALDQLLTKQGIPYEIDEAAFVHAMQDKDVVKKTEIDRFTKLKVVTRAEVLKRLLQQVPASDAAGVATYVPRRDHVEITTQEAKTIEARGVRTPLGNDAGPASVPLPPLAYAAFDDVPLPDALKELAHATESTIILDGRAAADAKTKVTAELIGVPVDVAVQLLADMANLKMVRVANVYYVTSVKNADALQKEEDKRRQEPSDNPTTPARGGAAALAAPHPAGKDGAPTHQSLVRSLLPLIAVAMAPAPTHNDEDTPTYRALMTQKKLAARIDYELPIPTNLHTALDELLARQDIASTVNEHAFAKAGHGKEPAEKADVDKIDVMKQVPRRVVLDKLLLNISAKSDDGAAVYVVRPGYVEITTRKAYRDEFYPGSEEAVTPPLAYAIFRKAPLREALAELAETTGANVVIDPRMGDEAAEKVTATFTAVPLDSAVRVLADEAGLKLARLGNVYYVTSPKNARVLQSEEDKRKRPSDKAPTAVPSPAATAMPPA